MKTVINYEPFADFSPDNWFDNGCWPASWITCPSLMANKPAYMLFERTFSMENAGCVRVHVSADERYQLFLDGKRIGRGPERGEPQNWFFETYDLDLAAGAHTIRALVWWIGPDNNSACAQMTVRPAFLFAAEDQPEALLNTGKAPWKCALLDGYAPIAPSPETVAGPKERHFGNPLSDFKWLEPYVISQAVSAELCKESPLLWRLAPAMLPAMLEETVQVGTARHVEAFCNNSENARINAVNNLDDECIKWTSLFSGQSALTIPSNTSRRVIVDLEDYYCAYPCIALSSGKGAKFCIAWAESLYEKESGNEKGNRDEIEGKLFRAVADVFEPDGSSNREYETLWWRAGRYLEVIVTTAAEPLVIDKMSFIQTHYDFNVMNQLDCSDPRFAELVPTALRALDMCSHESYMDCPFYEQLMYVGDTRLEVLTTFMISRDNRLPRKASVMFDRSRLNSGLTQSRFPSRKTQIIPPFSLWWVGMVYDWAMYQDDFAFVKSRMPGVRAVLEAFRGWINDNGLLEGPNGWNFTDWVPGWFAGIPPSGDKGVSAILNLHLAYTLDLAAKLEAFCGETLLARRNQQTAQTLTQRTIAEFYDTRRGLIADDFTKEKFSEHAQCLALLTGLLPQDMSEAIGRSLCTDTDMARTTIYFTHYLFETYRVLGRMDLFFERMKLWFDLPNYGFKTTFEEPEPSRSDCHAWGAHPIYHFYSSILGIRPSEPGFKEVSIEPMLGPLTKATGKMAHPHGIIEAGFEISHGRLLGKINLPDAVSGIIKYQGSEMPLVSGEQDILLG